MIKLLKSAQHQETDLQENNTAKSSKVLKAVRKSIFWSIIARKLKDLEVY